MFARCEAAQMNVALCSITKSHSSSHCTGSSAQPETQETQHHVTEKSVAETPDPKTEFATIENRISPVLEQEYKQQVANSHIESNVTVSASNLVHQAEAFEKQKKFLEAFALYEYAAELRHPQAQFKVGARYLNTSVKPSIRSQGFRLLRESAEKGNPGAISRLNYLLRNGMYVPGMTKQEAETYKASALKLFTETGYKAIFDALTKQKFGQPKINVNSQQCLFEGHGWHSQDNYLYSCPTLFTKGQSIYFCETCHQVFHPDCIANWRKRWRITEKDGCPNPKCSNQDTCLLICTAS